MITAMVPAKSLGSAKGRLAVALTAAERGELAMAMLEDVVAALQRARCVDVVAVVSPDADILSRAKLLGAEAILQPPNVRGLNAGLGDALRLLSPVPDASLVILADVPEVRPDDVAALIEALPEAAGAVLCASDDGGTNAMCLRPPDALPFRFGPGSAASHREEAARAGVTLHELRLDSLSRDIDTPEDLRALALRPVDTATHRLLARLGIAGRVRA